MAVDRYKKFLYWFDDAKMAICAVKWDGSLYHEHSPVDEKPIWLSYRGQIMNYLMPEPQLSLFGPVSRPLHLQRCSMTSPKECSTLKLPNTVTALTSISPESEAENWVCADSCSLCAPGANGSNGVCLCSDDEEPCFTAHAYVTDPCSTSLVEKGGSASLLLPLPTSADAQIV